MAEAMALGKPVIATGYSGNLHFMTPENSYLVNYVMSNVPAGCEPYPETAVWAEPDLDHAARLMREVYDRPAASRARAQRGQLDVLQHHNVRTSGAVIAARLERIRAKGEIASSFLIFGSDAPGSRRSAAGLPALEARLPHLERFAHPTSAPKAARSDVSSRPNAPSFSGAAPLPVPAGAVSHGVAGDGRPSRSSH